MEQNQKILATVGGKSITEQDVAEFLAAMGPRAQQYRTPEGHAAVLEELIARKLFLLEAQRNLYEAEPAFKAELTRLKENLLSGYAIEKALSAIRVTDKEIEAFYEENKSRFGGGETVTAAHILVDSEEKAKELRAQIEKGEITFADAAREHSDCPSKEVGGSLGSFGRGQMVKEFDEAAFSLPVGEISAPVKTGFGWHLILVSERGEKEAPALSEVRSQIEQKLLADKQGDAYRSKINQLKIVYPVDKF